MKMAKKEKYIQPCVIRAPPGTPREAMVFTATTHGGYTQFKNVIFSPNQLEILVFYLKSYLHLILVIFKLH